MNDENRNSLGNFIQSVNNQTQQSESNNGSPQNRGKFDGEKSLKNLLIAIGIVVGSFILLGVITGAFGSDDTPKEQVKKSANTSPKEDTKGSISNEQVISKTANKVMEKDLNLTPEQFKSKFNELASGYGATIRVSKINIFKDKAIVFQGMMNPNIGFTGTINKETNKIKDVAILYSPDGTAENATNGMIAFASLVLITNPTLTDEQGHNLFDQLGLFKKDVDIMNMNSHVTVNHVKYSMISLAKSALTFTAEMEK